MTDYLTKHLVVALVITALTASGCSLILDENRIQCTADADCQQFGGHPLCQAGVCVPSGLGPADCFFGEPTKQEQFALRCTTAQAFQFDNCALGLCNDTALATAFTTSVPPANLGTVPPPVTMQPTPTVPCASAGEATGSSVVYITGSTNLPPLLKAVQPLLYSDPDNPPYTAVFAPQTSCKGAAAVYDPAPSKHLIVDTPNNYAFYYNASGVQTFCRLDSAGNIVDVGESDVYPSSCGYSAAPGIADYSGPIQAITFVVPSSSKQTSISAEAAHLVFGAGSDHGKAFPWTDAHLYFIRSSGTGTVQLPSRAIGVDPTAWWGIDRLSAPNLVLSMEGVDPNLAEATIGILSSDFADKSRANVRVLAFQQRGQRYGFLPDSSPGSFDKANVRDGHYPIWGAIHFVAATQNGSPSAAATALITRFTVAKLNQTLVSAIVDAGFVPPCAMKVTHTSEVGPLTSYQPPFGCGCFYDKLTSGATTCQVCGGPGDCPTTAPVCNYGYCEKQ